LRLSIVTLAELFYGVAKLPANSLERNNLQAWVTGVERQFAGQILPFDRRAAIAHGAIRARLMSIGREIKGQDSYIAAIALARNLPLATRNGKDFANVGLDLIDPWNL
jgi:predicted nucleic acid-binding protein